MFKPSLDQVKNLKGSSDRSSPAAAQVGRDYSFYDYHWDGPKRFHFPVWQPRQTTLFVVFDGESRRLFSSARILLYYSKSSLKDARSNVWDIQPLGSVIHSFRSQVQHAPQNASTLPKLTVAFEVTVGQTSASKPPFGVLALRSSDSTQELRRDSITVLLEHELALTSETSSLSLSFTHSTLLCTSVTSGTFEQHTVPTNPVTQIELITTRIVRVLPPESARPKFTNGCLPTELLIKTFEDDEFRSTWHDDLLSFAQVCRTWSCAMHVLQSRLSFSDGCDDDDRYHSRHLLDTYALAKALTTKPVLGRAFRRLTTNNLGESQSKRTWENVVFGQPPRKDPARFMEALVAILRVTKNLQCLHLGQLDEPGPDPRQADALFTVLTGLHHLRTFSIGPTEEEEEEEGPVMGLPPTKCRWSSNGHGGGGGDKARMLSVAQLARCMARWPALKSLKVYHLQAGTVPAALGIWRFHWALRPAPACALTQLVLCRSYVSDRDLVHLFGGVGKGCTGTSSNANAIARRTSTLERLVLDTVGGITNAGLAAFLLVVSQSLVSLTVRDVALPPFRQRGNLILVGVRGGVNSCVSGGGGGMGGVCSGAGNGKVISSNGVSSKVINRRLGSTGVINGYGCGRRRQHSERALDVVLDKLPRLRELRIGGDVASELMLDRRSKMFLASCGGRASSSSSEEEEEDKAEEGEEGTRVPVVRLWVEVDVPRLRGFVADGKWPGWCTPGKVA